MFCCLLIKATSPHKSNVLLACWAYMPKCCFHNSVVSSLKGQNWYKLYPHAHNSVPIIDRLCAMFCQLWPYGQTDKWLSYTTSYNSSNDFRMTPEFRKSWEKQAMNTWERFRLNCDSPLMLWIIMFYQLYSNTDWNGCIPPPPSSSFKINHHSWGLWRHAGNVRGRTIAWPWWPHKPGSLGLTFPSIRLLPSTDHQMGSRSLASNCSCSVWLVFLLWSFDKH